MDSTPASIVVAGGGTAGHIEPALAVGEALKERHGARVTALGTARGLETDLVPARGFDLRLVTPVPVPRAVNLDLFKLPFRVVRAVREARAVLRDVEADALIGFGGYVAAPAYLAARSLGLPFLIHEANARAGIANKLGVRLGGTGFTAVAGSGLAGEVVGVPVRRGFNEQDAQEAAERARQRWNLNRDRPVVLVTGGSQGAATLNRAVDGAIGRLEAAGYQVLHAYGAKNDAPPAHDHHVAVPYIDDMPSAYAVADLIVCRSGAMTVAEVTAAGLPAVYVPLPHGNGEQALNAGGVVATGAARLVPDADFTADRMIDEVAGILGDRSILQSMRAAAAGNSAGDVAGLLADRIIAAVHQ